MTEEQKKIKKYVNAIERHLHMPLKQKVRINTDLATEIHLRMEAGATADEVIQEMGSPKEVAERFNEEMGSRQEGKNFFRILFLCFSIFVAILFLVFAVEGFWENQRIEREMAEASVSIIGGADGPTSVFIAGKISAPGKAMTILGIAVGFLAACFLASEKGYKRSMIFSAAGLIISILPVVQFIIQFQGLAVKISGDFILILAVGVLLNTGVFIASWKKRNK